jgi:hypothetical protein
MSTPEDYLAKAAEAAAQLGQATSESERTRLKWALGAWLRLASHQAEAAERAAMKPAPRIVPEKPRAAAAPRLQGWSMP